MIPRTIIATRYVTPLREGGSLPAIVEGDDDGLYVLKFRGAGQGAKALIAELVVGKLAQALDLPVPEIVFVDVDANLGRSEPDSEIQALVQASAGLNLALDYLPGSLSYDPLRRPPPDPELASAIVWFDAYTTNVDRTARNTNILIWHRRLWLIDHGAALYVHHTWGDYLARSRTPFAAIKDHVLLPYATAIAAADADLRVRLTPELVQRIVALIPDTWLSTEPGFADTNAQRAAYTAYLLARLEHPRLFVQEAIDAHTRLL